MKRKLFLLSFLLFVGIVYSQQPIAIQLTEKDKLPDNEFYDIIESKDGIIWLAADKGLFKYNGKTFTNLSHPEKRGLSVFGLYQDDQNRIWCNTISGQFFYVVNDKMVLFTDLKDELKGQLPEFVIHKNKLCIFFEKGIYEIDITTKKKAFFRDKKDSNTYYGFPVRSKQSLYFALSNTIKKIDKSHISTVYTFTPQTIFAKNNTFISFENSLFFSSLIDAKQHFYVKQNENSNFQQINVPNILQDIPIIRTLYIDKKFWFCTHQGIFIGRLVDNKVVIDNHYFAEEACTKVVKDTNKNYWITTLNNGIYVLPNIAIQKIETDKEIGLIKDMLTVEDNIIFGTTKGVIGILEKKNHQIKKISLPTSDEISAMVYDKDKKLIFISQKSTSFIWNLAKATIQKCLSFSASKSMFYDGSGILLNACYDRANSTFNPFEFYKISATYSLKNPSFIDNPLSFTLKNERMKRAYTCLVESRTKNKWVGFVDDLICFDKKNNQRIIKLNNKPIFAIDIVQDSDEVIWVSTFENGIIGIKNNKAFINLDVSNGLLSNQTGKLKVEGNNLWISSSKGIQKYNLNKQLFENISIIDGFDNYEITDLEIIDNQIYISSNKGIFILDSKRCFKKLASPILYFTEFSVYDQPIILQNTYSLDYDKNAIKIAFNANGFQSSQNINYIYRLKGFDERWTVLENGIDFVRFSSLPSGNYRFEVKAKYVNGIVSKPIYLDILIKKPFWQTWWFYILVSVVVIGVFWLYFKNRLNRIEKEKNILLEKAQVDKELIFYQLENLRSQMNPHFIFNALNSIQEYIVTNEKVNASAYLVKFSKLIRLYLEHSRENEVSLEEEIKALQFYLELEKDRFEEKLNFTISVDSNINPQLTKIPSLFIQPYVENSIKHGLLHKKENRLLKVNFNKVENLLECIIEDNGIGRKASEEINKHRRELHKSFATSANEKRVELINKTRNKKVSVKIEDLKDVNQVAMGTRVIISIPF